MSEGKPLFELELIEKLARNGITIEAERDFEAGEDAGDAVGGHRYRYGRLGLYGYRNQIVMRRRERVVFRMWLPGE